MPPHRGGIHRSRYFTRLLYRQTLSSALWHHATAPTIWTVSIAHPVNHLSSLTDDRLPFRRLTRILEVRVSSVAVRVSPAGPPPKKSPVPDKLDLNLFESASRRPHQLHVQFQQNKHIRTGITLMWPPRARVRNVGGRRLCRRPGPLTISELTLRS